MFLKYYGILFFLLSNQLTAQVELKGLWQGFIKHSHQDIDAADVIYIQFDEDKTGFTRIELLNETVFAIKQFSAKQKDNKVSIEENYIKSSANSRDAPKCKLVFDLEFEPETAYLKGFFKSSDCRRVMGEVVLYRNEGEINMDKEPKATHYWKYNFVKNYNKGLPAPEVLLREQKNFEFKPIYFDHDKSEIRPEFYDYLNKIARLLDGIHDLRIEVTGHTDAVGTDQYNIGLSERRAKSIKDYFLSRGIPEDKLEIDFKGERKPVDTNETPDGKQRNRRVDFEFI